MVRSRTSPAAAGPASAATGSRPDAGPPLRGGVAATASPARDTPAVARSKRQAARPAGFVPASSDSARAASREAALSVLDPTPALELTRLERPSGQDELELGGMWRTMSWDGAKAEVGERLPHIDGLPVVQVQVQSGDRKSVV